MNQITVKKTVAVIKTGSDIVASAITNTLLFTFYLYGAGFGKYGSVGMYRAFDEAQQTLDDCNYQSIKNAFYQLTKAGLVTRSRKRSHVELTITNEGKKRIAELFPTYRNERPWDGHVYLISYDIPTKANISRNILRAYIRRTGGALLQESLWLNPYNPQSLIEEFVETRAIKGTVLVSKLGKDGAVGDEKLTDLISRIYKYPTLRERYTQFIDQYNKKQQPFIKTAMVYTSILRDDPQLPFALEPKNFPGHQANLLFKSIRSINQLE